MTSLIAVDRTTIRHDAARAGVTFSYSDGARFRAAFVPDAVVAAMLKVRTLSAAQAEGFVRNKALRLALHLANRHDPAADDEAQLTLDDLLKLR